MNITQGEWKVYTDPRISDKEFFIDLAHQPHEKINSEIAVAYKKEDARLIAAAPDMYQALRKVRANIGHIIMTKPDALLVDEIDKALAKAEGK
ncbi:MAG: hypothetical protein WC554_11825 [Clostridia bacterium]|jgi:hypothetical protein